MTLINTYSVCSLVFAVCIQTVTIIILYKQKIQLGSKIWQLEIFVEITKFYVNLLLENYPVITTFADPQNFPLCSIAWIYIDL